MTVRFRDRLTAIAVAAGFDPRLPPELGLTETVAAKRLAHNRVVTLGPTGEDGFALLEIVDTASGMARESVLRLHFDPEDEEEIDILRTMLQAVR
jgi:hypothetical protein